MLEVFGRGKHLGLSLLITVLIILGMVTGLSAEQVIPARYKGEGYFSGGKPLENAVLGSIRFGKHEDFVRVVFDFFVQNESLEGAPWHPPYRIEYKKYPYRFRIVFDGVKYLEDARVETKNALPLSIVTTADNTIKVIEIFVNEPALFKVIEVDDPAKLALDIKKAENEPIPRVYAVRLQGIEDVESAFRIVETHAFPEGIHPDVLVLGNQFFVEAVFLTLEEASGAATALEKEGFKTLISERDGNELPHP